LVEQLEHFAGSQLKGSDLHINIFKPPNSEFRLSALSVDCGQPTAAILHYRQYHAKNPMLKNGQY